jgi:hypothetical protein
VGHRTGRADTGPGMTRMVVLACCACAKSQPFSARIDGALAAGWVRVGRTDVPRWLCADCVDEIVVERAVRDRRTAR